MQKFLALDTVVSSARNFYVKCLKFLYQALETFVSTYLDTTNKDSERNRLMGKFEFNLCIR